MFRFSLSAIFLCVALGASAKAQDNLTWPRAVKTDNFKFTLHQPQIEKLERNKMQINIAFSTKMNDDEDEDASPLLGAINAVCTLETNKEQKRALCKKLKINSVQIPTQPKNAKQIKDDLVDRMSDSSLTLSYDQLLVGMRAATIVEREHKTHFSTDPPKIYISYMPTALITIDGNPVMRTIKGTLLKRIINTPFVILFDTTKTKYYLRAGNTWQISDDLNGHWQLATTVPTDVERFQEQLTFDQKSAANIKRIIVTLEPATLIEFHGKPEFARIRGTDLQYSKNTDAKVIKDDSQTYYVLASGRWFSASELKTNAEWSYVPGKDLPKSLQDIPENLPISSVLVSVPGTLPAKEAVIRNQISEIKKYSKASLKMEVKYDGRPRFEKIAETRLQYAINSNKPVIRMKGRYFANDQTVWFEADSPKGPWEVSDRIPNAIYDIPPENPLYKITYCSIYDADEESVTIGCTPGYQGSFVYDDVVVYGTGYHYIPWVGNEYFGAPFSYNFEYQYDPAYGWYSPAPYMWFATAQYAWAIGDATWHPSEQMPRQKQTEIALTDKTNATTPVPASAHPQELYTANHGNVYRKQGKDSWQRHTKRGWQPERNHYITRNLRDQYQIRYRGRYANQRYYYRPMPKRRYYSPYYYYNR